MATMKAVRIHRFGGSEVLQYEDVEVPTPQSGQVLVEIHASGVNPIDWKLRSGVMQHIYNPPLPMILGGDLAGVVAETGAETGDLKVGDAVYGMPRAEIGTYAKFIAVDAADLALKPQSLSFIEAASLPAAALTAWQCLFDVGGLGPGQTVFIHGAAGGVGSMAVQFAKAKGATVIATATGDKVDFVKDLGADRVIDYKLARFEDGVSDVDLVLDVIAGETQARSWQIIKPGGVLVSTIPPAPIPTPEAAARGVQGRGIMVSPSASILSEVAALIDQGKIKHVTSTTFPLAEARAAHDLGESGNSRGKIVLTISE